MHTNNRKKDALLVGEGPADGLGGTTVTEEDKYLIDIQVCFATMQINFFVC